MLFRSEDGSVLLSFVSKEGTKEEEEEEEEVPHEDAENQRPRTPLRRCSPRPDGGPAAPARVRPPGP